MALFGIRSKLKSMVKQALNIEPENAAVSNPISPSTTSFEPEPVPQDINASVEEEPIANEIQTEAVTEPEDIAPPLEEPSQPVESKPSVAEGPPLSMEAVQEILDEDVRPALQMDGGDISLVKIEDNNIYVKLVGACSTCPSSVMTMRMGVENLLREEFPSMNELIEVTDEPAVEEAES